MPDNEIVIRARDAARQTLTQIRRDVSSLERELRQASDELERTGNGADRVDQLSRSLTRARTEAQGARTRLADLNGQVDRAAAGTNRLQQAWNRTGQAVRNNADKIQRAGLIAAGALGFVGYKSIDAASDLVEAQSKAMQVFGDSGQAILQWSKNANKAMGQTQQQAIDGASTFAVFGKSAGLTGDQLVGFSTQLTGLASDMASFFNSSPEEAIEAISAALRGENDPLERYGVLLNDAVERQEALKMGLIQTTSQALTPQQRVLVAQSLILQQTSDAQGDFARTSNQLANSQRIAQAQLHDTQAEIGQRFLPVALQLTHVLSSLLGFFGHLPTPVQSTIVVVAALGIAAMIAAPRLIMLADAISAARARAVASGGGGLRGALGRVTSFLGGPWGAALAVAAVGVGIFAKAQADAKQRTDDLQQSLDQSTGKITAQTRSVVAQSLNQSMSSFDPLHLTKTPAKGAKELGIGLDTLTDAILGNKDAWDKVTAVTGTDGPATSAQLAVRHALQGTSKSLDEAQAKQADYLAALGPTASKTLGLTDATSSLTTEQTKEKTASETQADAVKKLGEQFDSLAGKTRSLRSAQAGLEESIDALADKQLAKLHPALNKTRKGFDLTRESGRTAQQKLFDVADAAETAANAAADKGKWGQAKQLIDEGRDAIAKQAEKWGLAKQDAKRYADTVLGMPKTIAQQIALKVKLEAQASIDAWVTLHGRSLSSHAAAGMPGIGDTARPLGIGAGVGHGALMGIHQKIAASTPGVQHVTSTVRGFALGSPNSDHRFGRAYDVAGTNLGQYASRVRAFGGFAEMHGAGAGRHLHVVPAPRGVAVTGVAARGAGTVVHAPQFTFPGVTDEAGATRAGAAAARAYQRELDRAARQRS